MSSLPKPMPRQLTGLMDSRSTGRVGLPRIKDIKAVKGTKPA